MAVEQDKRTRFEECVIQCADSIYRVAFRLVGNQALASELVQETYLNAWKSLDRLERPEKMRSWIFAILRNQYSKVIRKESRAVMTADLGDHADRAESEFGKRDEVQQAVERLDDNHRLPILLVSMEGLSVDEAAEILDLPRGTVLSRLHRGREKLRQTLESLMVNKQ